MNNPKLSIIVPVYNAEKTLERCVNSILRNIIEESEIILIDDGSKDNSVRICDDYAEKDTRIKVIHKKNGGVSSARNAGLDVASGKYLMFVDSDDEMVGVPNLEGEFDLLFGMVEVVKSNSSNEKIEITINRINEHAIDRTNVFYFIERNLEHQLIKSPWGKVYILSIIKNNRIRYSEDLRFGEDLVFNLIYFSYCKVINTTDTILYKYYSPASWEIEKYKMSVKDSVHHLCTINNSALKCSFKNIDFYKNNFGYFKCLCEYDMPVNYKVWYYNEEIKFYYQMLKKQFTFKFKLKYKMYPTYYKNFYSIRHKLRKYLKKNLNEF